ncbi:uncharacterized protein EI90DRAFT_2663175 [Cantharellus anzutake]|uniref:uncharacterized protein n=1 Tax=Cantharellus anzutake TaxID=1750568 RepID=UPI001905A222|nr:uncharacterized protein EI90DRAFT_2663175 [Cantharellus anzutake]KAF8337543.1 hypothetical protein EI90DRAFT_2663175 [Cantharellus anzutake]
MRVFVFHHKLLMFSRAANWSDTVMAYQRTGLCGQISCRKVPALQDFIMRAIICWRSSLFVKQRLRRDSFLPPMFPPGRRRHELTNHTPSPTSRCASTMLQFRCTSDRPHQITMSWDPCIRSSRCFLDQNWQLLVLSTTITGNNPEVLIRGTKMES